MTVNALNYALNMIRLSIADVKLLINTETCSEIRDRNPDHRDFFPQERFSKSGAQVHIQICMDPMPDVSNKTILFEAESSWSIKQDGKFYWIVSNSPMLQQPLWIARFNQDFSDGMVYCSDRFKDTQHAKNILFNPVNYPLDQILFIHYLALNDGMLIHSAGWRINGSGWIFAGKSGAGKSTMSNLIGKEIGVTFLSDDRIIIRKIGHEFLMYGTPWPGDAGIAVNQSAPLKGVFFLNQGNENKIAELKSSDAISYLFPVISIPWYDRDKVSLMMDFCESLLAAVPMYELTFRRDETVADFVKEFV